MKIVVLDALTFGETSLAPLEALGDIEVFATTSPDETAQRIHSAEVIVTNKVVISESLMDEAHSLKLICVAATGMNNIDLEAAERRGIPVKNVAGYSTDSVIQHTFSMLFYLMGHSRYYDEYVKSGAWQKSPIFTHVERSFYEVKGKTWGIIGLGEIGRGVARVATAFGANVQYYSTSGKNTNTEYKQVSLSSLLEQSDIITIHAPLNADTQDLIGQSELLQLKDNAVLLNLGRGGIVDEEALARTMEMKPLYVGLDVLAKEPMQTPHPLLSIKEPERLYITPHTAWTSVEARNTLIAQIAKNIQTL